MQTTNHFCDVNNCSYLATAFGVAGSTKLRCCPAHTSVLVSKHMTICSIAGFYFIESVKDVPAFEERRRRVQMALGSVDALEAGCEAALRNGLALLETKKQALQRLFLRCCEEVQLHLVQEHTEARLKIAEMRRELETFLEQRDASLQSYTQELYEEPQMRMRCLQVVHEDCTVALAKTLLKSWKVEGIGVALRCLGGPEDSSVVRTRSASEAVTYNASRLGANDEEGAAPVTPKQEQVAEAAELEELFHFASDEESTKRTVQGLLEVAHTQQMQASECEKWLRRSWNLVQRSAEATSVTAAVAMELSEVLSLRRGKFTEADEILRQAYELVAKIDPLSEEAMKISNAIAAVYFHSGKHSLVEATCQWILDTFANAELAAEHFWTTVLYLSLSLSYLDKNAEAEALVQRWQSKSLRSEGPLSELLRTIACAKIAARQKIANEAENLYKKAKVSAERLCPSSSIRAINLRLLGLLYDTLKLCDKAEESYRLAKSIFSSVAPMSIEAALNLNNMGGLCFDMKNYTEAEGYFTAAKRIYNDTAPLTKQAANNMQNMGRYFKECGRYAEAEEHFLIAYKVYQEVAPKSTQEGCSLLSLGLVYEAIGENEEALYCIQTAHTLLTNTKAQEMVREADIAIARLQEKSSRL